MNHIDLEFIKSLDPERIDGTIQAFIMMIEEQGVSTVPTEQALKKLIVYLKREKDSLVKDNIQLSINGGRLE